MSPAYTNLGPITISEGASGADFAGPATDVIELSVPAGWQFNPVLPTFSYTTGANITGISATITSTKLTINLSVNNTTAGDDFTITGLQVQATSAGAAAGNIYASSVTGVTGITSGTNFGSLTLTPVVAPAVTIAANPGSTICAGTNVVYTPNPSGGGGSPSYTWFLNSINVGSGNSYSNSSLATGSSVWCTMTSNATCIVPGAVTSNTITMTVNPVPSAIAGTTNACPGTATTLTDATPLGVWSSANPTVATVNGVGKVFGVTAGNALISYTVSGCAATASVVINTIPLTPVLTPSVTSVCNGSIITLQASGTATPPVVSLHDFNSALSPWTVDNTGSTGATAAIVWKQVGDGFVNLLGTYHSPDNTGFAMCNPDAAGSGPIISSKLISPVFSLAGYASAFFSFQHAYEYWPAGDMNVEVDISTNGGSSWSLLRDYKGSNIGNSSNFVAESIPLNPYVGMTNLRLRFYYYSDYGYYWVVDNVTVTGTSSGVVPTWSPITYLYADAAATTPYVTNAQANTVYMKPSGITSATVLTYTATATNVGCTSQGTNTVTVNSSPGVFSGATNICVGLTTALTNSVSGGTWSSSNTTIANVGQTTGVVTGVAIGTATITYTLAGGCYTTTAVTVYPAPSSISGSNNVCAGAATTLSVSPSGGTWSSGNLSVATVLSSSGVVGGASQGVAVITYALGAGCISTFTITVNPIPSSIAGATSVCAGSAITLSNSVNGGTWSSSNTTLATISSGGYILRGVAAGTVNVTYALAGNCIAIAPVTIYALPTTISGNTSVCRGLTTTLSNGAVGGVWSSDNTSVATITLGGGVVTGVTAGTANVTYTIGLSCIAFTQVTVNPLPQAITGLNVVCAGSSIALTDLTAGGTWSSSNTSTATIDGNGILTGASAALMNVTYTLNTGCIATKAVTVNPLPAAITGGNTVCIGMTTNLSDVTGGGTWSSSNTGVATVVQATGVVYGATAGSATVTYALNTGCFITRAVTVNALPSVISGVANVCSGQTTTLSNAVSGGTWTSGNISLASVNSSTGVVTGGNAGTVNITYTLGTSCMVSIAVLVNPLSPITGINNVCEGLTTTLSDATTGGTWSSVSTGTATINPSTGVIIGIVAGTSTIYYILPTGCTATTSVVVNPVPGPISGNTNVCFSGTTMLSNAGGGTWSSSNSSIAAVNVNTGTVLGVALGTTTITYSLSFGCIATTSVIVNPLPAAISGAPTVCVAATIQLTDITTGGTWSSSNTSFATISGAGVVTGIAAGPVTITYTLPTGCVSIKNITVNPLPLPITGITNVCSGLTTMLSNETAGGTWSSNSPSIASINTSVGFVTGGTAGTAIISYGLSTGCFITTSVVVNPLPAGITGTPALCMGLTTSLSNTTAGGTWSSSNTSIATILSSGSGVVTSVAPGTTIITYTLGTGCIGTRSVIVNPLPGAITGNSPICVNATGLLVNTGGGTWSSSNATIASVISSTGVVTGGAPGNVTITYTLATGCVATASLLVNPLPAVITGSTGICMGFTTTLSSTTSGGTWTSGSTSVATIVPSGTPVVTSVSPGTTIITYTLGTGCSAVKTVTVNPLPSSISGNTSVCVGLSTPLTDGGGGTWSSSNSSVATVVAATGVVTGAVAGSSIITYTLPTGCITTVSMTVNPLPSTIAGLSAICHTLTTTLSDATTGGTWSSSNTTVASINLSSGFLTALSPGTTTITYTLGTSCIITKVVTVNPLPANIAGQTKLCVLATTTLSDATTSGAWSSSNTLVAGIGVSSGTVTGVSTGSVIITYKLNTGCLVTKALTVNALPPAITGNTGICFGGTSTLSNSSTGGTWSSSNATVAIVGLNSGDIFAVGTGTSTVTYTVDTGCTATALVTVNPLPATISGSSGVCVGQGTTLSNTSGGGTWISSNTSIATVGASNGIVTGVSPGAASISYTLSTGCGTSKNVTVNASPTPFTGNPGICLGSTITLSNSVTGGTWSSSNTLVAPVGVATGVVAGGFPGSAVISYITTGNCAATIPVTVNSLPGNIQGSNTLCVGLSTQLSSSSASGTWTSSNTGVATISNLGIVYGVASGTASINYTLGTGCAANKNITVFAAPSAISGNTSLCFGSTTTLSNTVPGGTWSSSNTLVAPIDMNTGLVAGSLPGSAVITYVLAGNCSITTPLTVNSLPGNIQGSSVLCVGLNSQLSDATSGGTWSSSNTSIATINNSGVIYGVSPGSVTVSYKLTTGCTATKNINVFASPGPISGSTSVCIGLLSTLSNAVSGGVWTSSNTNIAIVDPAAGTVSGLAAGSSTISYSISGTCIVSVPVTVNLSPAAISGYPLTCVGLTTTLSNSVTGGTWTSSNTSVATVTVGGGSVKGVTAGTSIITYKLAGNCIATTSVTINPPPTAIVGNTNLCIGSVSSLSNTVGGGTWSSSNTIVAMINANTGSITALSPGSTVITYAIVSGCAITANVTVNSLPSSISGVTTVCVGTTTKLSDATAGGTWTASNTSIATVNPTTGIVTGVAPGVVNIKYTLSTGCAANRNVTVSPLPTAISGITNVCLSSASTLSNGTPGGTWTSSNTSVATVDAATGVVSGVTPGTATIVYNLGAGCTASAGITVISAPAAITGITTLCIGTITSLSDATTGGVWSSNNTAVATVPSGSGAVSGVATGTAIITYSIGTGCAATATVIVNSLPSAITGNNNICVGITTTLSNAATGGTWSSNSTSIVIVGATTGSVTGFSPGIANIIYSPGAGCAATTTVSVGALPAGIVGNATLCAGTSTTMSDATPNGTWSSGNTSIISIDQVTGIATGVGIGSANVTYTLPTGCVATKNVTVVSFPSAISGNTTVCLGSTTILSNTILGGVWTSGTTTIATIGSSSAIVSGLSTGTANISYSIGSGCVVSTPVNVIALPPAIAGNKNVCIGSVTQLSNSSGAGTWTSAATSIATVDLVSGLVSGVAPGNTVVSYTAGTGCTITTTVTVNPLPSAISGAANVCVGSFTTLSDAGGGTWSSGNLSVATIGLTSGIVNGVSTGAVDITYTLGTGCITTTTITIIPLPSAIVGSTSICSGSATSLTDAASGGTWSSSNTFVATIGVTSGIATGAVAGNTIISYRLGSGCAVSATLTVNALPSAISGTATVCEGLTTSLSSAGSGTWSSSDPLVASVGLTTGIVAGNDAGTAVITYMLGTGCMTVKTVTVNPLPDLISGATTVCVGASANLSNTVVGGTWSSGSPGVATVLPSAGVVFGVASGTAAITYKLPTGCLAAAVVTVNPLPGNISGTRTVCAGSATALSDAGGGTWISSNSSIAAVNVSSGVVSGVSSGNARITYTLGTGCISVATVTVFPLPSPISGFTGVCVGSVTNLTDITNGGTWISGAPGIATIGASSGIVSGISPGIAPVTYSLNTGCITVTSVTVNSLPATISGPSGVCIGSAVTLSNVAGGAWTSSNSSIAAVDASSGVVSGITAGTVRVTYSLGTGCYVTSSVTVHPLPSAITGITTLCVGLTTHLSDVGGGTWSSDNLGVATVGVSNGIVTGAALGASVISYRLNTGCATTTTVTVKAVPTSIFGIPGICAASATTLSNGVAGGTWTSSNTGIAAIGLNTGLMSGISPGTATITYTMGAACFATTSVTIYTIPGTINGPAAVCLGSAVTLNDAPSGGAWSSSNTSIATVDASTGVVTGVAPGTALISYSLGSGCTASRLQTVHPVAPVTGTNLICAGETVVLSDAISGGTWSSSNTLILVVTNTGIVSGISGGMAHIIYTLPTGCTSTLPVNVNASTPITGLDRVCIGSAISLNNATPGGTWSSSNTLVATISVGGVVSGIITGTVTIAYSLPSGCVRTTTVSVNPVPPAITGITDVCVGGTTYLSNAIVGGTWSHVAPSGILGIGATSGAITGLALGSQPVTYSSPMGCTAVTTVTVHPPPSVISGPVSLCAGAAATFNSLTTGGIWTSGNTAVATIDPATGVLTGVSGGTAIITYNTGIGCITTKAVIINPLPPPITGVTDICAGGATTIISDAAPGGTWSSTSVTVSTTGVVLGFSAGWATITYTLPTGCYTSTMLYVNPLPDGVTGNTNICVGGNTVLSSATTGGMWSTANTNVATINQFNGQVTGIAAGNAVITYTIGTGCTVAAIVTVSPPPPAITGSTSVCVADAAIVSDAMPGGVWSSASTTIGVGAASGVVTGIAAGPAVVTYTSPAGCFTTAPFTVNPLPVSITGANKVCDGGISTLSDYPTGGTWSSSNTSVAIIHINTGVVAGVSVGVTTITYTIGTGCKRTVPFTVNPIPPAITGPARVCAGSSITLSNTVAGGTWSSNNSSIATIGYTSGMVTGVASGNTSVTYTLSTGCTAGRSVFVDPLPALFNVTGGGTFCAVDSGRHIGLDGSVIGFTYRLYNSAVMVATRTGTGAALDFGLQTTTGSYMVTAANNITGCSATMNGSAAINVIPSVTPIVTVSTSNALCAGNIVTFTAGGLNLGTAQYVVWKVNGVNSGTGNPFNYIPTNGDAITCVVTGNAACVTSPTATATVSVTLMPKQTPSVTITVTPGQTVCSGTAATYLPASSFGGLAPVYKWRVNGAQVSTGPSYNFVPTDGDSVSCTMVSNYACLFTDSARSNKIDMVVVPYVSPTVMVTADPATGVAPGESITFTASASASVTAYQWYINHTAVPGATSPSWTGNSFANGDTVSCTVTAGGQCRASASDYVVVTVFNIGVGTVTPVQGDVQLVPNPNKGTFSLKGGLSGQSAVGNSDVLIEVTDMLGQVVYRKGITARNGKINETITLDGNLANGMYLLNLRAVDMSKVFHFVIEQ